MPSIITISVCSIQWFIVGYTIAYGDGGSFFGSLTYAFHRGVLAEPVGTIPAILFSQFQLVFEATVCAIAVGGFCERGRLLPVGLFIFVCSFRLCYLRSIADATSFGQPLSIAPWLIVSGVAGSWERPLGSWTLLEVCQSPRPCACEACFPGEMVKLNQV